MEIAFEQITYRVAPKRRVSTVALAGSFGLHIFLILATALLVVPKKFAPVSPDESVPVEIVPFNDVKPPDFVVPQLPFPNQRLLSAPPSILIPPNFPSVASSPPSDDRGMIRASTLFSSRAMEDPRSARAVAELQALAPAERIEQLCNYEGMEQIARADERFRPDFLIAYAMSAIRWRRSTLKAEGAAFRSEGNWYNLKYDCETAGEPAEVVGFAFEIGEEIPRSKWEEHYLAVADVHD